MTSLYQKLGFIFILVITSHALAEAKLAPCPPSPNCINTETPGDKKHFLPPMAFTASETKVMEAVIKTIQDMGGQIIEQEPHGLRASFTTRLLKYVDDFEVYIDTQSHLLHIRSASREGYYDFGVNKRRVNKFRKILQQKLNDS